jgi:uncharacterized protein
MVHGNHSMPLPWKDQLENLQKLQEIDAKKYQFAMELSEIPTLRQSQTSHLKAAQEALKEKEDTWKSLQLKLKESENELETKEGSIKKYEGQQMQVKTNKEYSALTKEINGLKADCSIFEDAILKLMDQIEAQKKSVDVARGEVKKEEVSVKADEALLKEKSKVIKAEIAKLDQDRKVYLPDLERQVIQGYEKTLRQRGGVALAVLQDQSCGGCNTIITPQTINEIILKEKMVVCEGCSRIIHQVSS